MKKQALALAVSALAASALMSGSPAQGNHKNTFTADETGCRNVVTGSFGQFQRLVAALHREEISTGSGVYNHAENHLSDRGVARANVVLEAPSCPDVTYTLNVYRAVIDDGGNYHHGSLLGSASRRGNGVDGTTTPFYVSTGVESLADDEFIVMLQVEVSDAAGIHDHAPDTPDDVEAAPDGGDGGGAGSAGWN